MASEAQDTAGIQVFNTPLESGIRSAIVLLTAYPAACDLQRLVQYDYLIVHSGDVANGPASLHPPTPHRAGELLVRRELVQSGLDLMATRSVVERVFSPGGISYRAGEYAVLFFSSLSAQYVTALRDRAKWVVERFQTLGDGDLNIFMREHWSQWGAEFVRHPFVEGDE